MLEETYCYFDMPAPKMGYQITYLEENGLYSDAVAHPVRSGNMVVFPCGYRPARATPICGRSWRCGRRTACTAYTTRTRTISEEGADK